MITIHIAFHAHLDPVWLWPWTSGLDEAIATCRSACDRLDAHPDISYSQGEAWTFAMIERADPALFARIRAHIAAGRWEVVNGWWTQPDCNLPGIDGLHAQLATGLDYVRDRFGLRPRCGFNPDSFGHCAALPDVLRAHGQDRYVMMRPSEGEMALPARLFRWRGAGGGTVTTWRVAGGYQGGQDGTIGLAQRALTELPPGCRHALALFGIGNHGGGPSERIIALLRAGRDSIPGARLEFSTIGRFFDAIEADAPALPEVAGELQQHAIGCYSVVRSVKTAVRRAEHALARAAQADPAADLAGSWRAMCAHHFHDTLGGSSLPEAYGTILDQLGGAAAAGDEALAYAVRRQVAALPGDAMPRVVFANPGSEAWSGWAEGLTYLEGPWVKQPWRLTTPQGAEVPFQVLNAGLGIGEWNWGLRRLLVRASLKPGELLPLRCDLSAPPASIVAGVEAAPGRIAAGATALSTGAAGPVLHTADGRALPIALHLLDDPSDTWSHGRDRYAEQPLATASWSPARVLEGGPLRAAIAQEGVIGGSTLAAEWRVYAGEAMVELLLTVGWSERHRLLKLVLPLAGEAGRVDGTPGAALARPNDGRELPLHDGLAAASLGVVCPDVFAADATPARLRLTLLRSPLMAHHDPSLPSIFVRPVFADRGEHTFRFRFRPGAAAAAALLAEARCWQRPPLVADCTRGMPCRMMEG